MKKTRLISLLLTAALAVSCLPMAVSANTEEAENLLDGATYKAVVVTTENDDGSVSRSGSSLKLAAFKNPDDTPVVEGNRFLTFAKRSNGTNFGFAINYTLTEEQAAKQLYIDFDMRTSQPDATAMTTGKNAAPNGTLTIGGEIFVAKNAMFAEGYHGAGNWYSLGERAIPQAKNAVGANVITYDKASGMTNVPNIDLDNFKIYYYNENNEPVYIMNLTENFLDNGIVPTLFVHKTLAEAVAFEDIEEPYYVLDSDVAYNTELTITLDEELEPGVYTLGGEFRHGKFSIVGGGTKETYMYLPGINTSDVIVKAGDSVVSNVVDDIWRDYEFEVVVAEATDTLTILVDGEEATIADPQAINFRNLTLTQTASFSEELVSANEENLLDGTVVTYNGAWERGDGYLYIPYRSAENYNYLYIDVLTKGLYGTTNEDGSRVDIKYVLGFDAKSIKHDSITFTIREGCGIAEREEFGLNDGHPVPTENNEIEFAWIPSSDGENVQQFTFRSTDWIYCETYFTPLKNDADHMKFEFTRGSSGSRGAVCMDNIVLTCIRTEYDAEGNIVATTEEVVYSNTFDTKYDLNNSASIITSGHAYLNIEVVPSAVTVTPTSGCATAFYDVAAVANKAGEYTFSATVASETEDYAYLVVNYADDTYAETARVAVTAEGVELTFTAKKEIESIEIVTEIEGEVIIANEMLTYSFEAPMGDVNGDGKVNPLDVVYLQRYLAGWEGYAALINTDAADVNDNDKVNMYDAVLLARHLAKWDGYEAMEDLLGIEDPASIID